MEPFAITQFDTCVHNFVSENKSQLLIGLGLLLSIAGLGFYAEQDHFISILVTYIPAFIFYVWAVQTAKKEQSIVVFIGIAIAARLLLLFAFPELSDDIYRFIWDGKIWLAGENPFDFLPSYWIENGMGSAENIDLFNQLNSPDYFTIYPPVCQAIFTLAVYLSPNSIWGAGFIMKIFLVAFEIGSIFLILDLLKKLKLPKWQSLLYALNPLVLIEISGNLHFEGAMVFFFLLAIWSFIQAKDLLGSLAISLSIASKLLPLMLLPLLINLLGWKRSLKIFSITGILLILFFAPLLSDVFFQNFGSSLDLYFQKFEFNASIYYFTRMIGQWISGYNLIRYLGPILALIAGASILLLASQTKKDDYQNYFQLAGLAFCLYLFLGTTIHPWYLILPIALFSFSNFRFIFLWSLLIFGTYLNYSFVPYEEQLWFVALEYILVFLFLFGEFRKQISFFSRKESFSK